VFAAAGRQECLPHQAGSWVSKGRKRKAGAGRGRSQSCSAWGVGGGNQTVHKGETGGMNNRETVVCVRITQRKF